MVNVTTNLPRPVQNEVTLGLSLAQAQVLRNLLGEVGGNGTPGVETVHEIRKAITDATGLKYKKQFRTQTRGGRRLVLEENA